MSHRVALLPLICPLALPGPRVWGSSAGCPGEAWEETQHCRKSLGSSQVTVPVFGPRGCAWPLWEESESRAPCSRAWWAQRLPARPRGQGSPPLESLEDRLPFRCHRTRAGKGRAEFVKSSP